MSALLLVMLVGLAACAEGTAPSGHPGSSTSDSAPLPLNDPTGIALDEAGNLWVANYRGDSLLMYRRRDVLRTGAPKPAVAIAGRHASVHGPNRLAFDQRGNLWVVNYGDNTVVAFSAQQLQAGGDLEAAVVLTAFNDDFDQPTGLTFDREGNLWVTNQRTDNVVQIGAADLVQSGVPAPHLMLRQPGGPNGILEAAMFDREGTVWLARYSDGRVVGIAARQLQTVGSPTPTIELPQQLSGPIGLAIDPTGRLWVTESDGGAVTAFAPGGGRVTGPVATISGATLRSPHTPAFDSSGDLWISCGNDTLVMFSAAQLAASRIGEPAVVLSSAR